MSGERWWGQPTAGTIVWCRFPENLELEPHRKPRPALILEVFDDEAPRFHVTVAYGTSKRTTTLYGGEFAILRASNSEAYELAGLSYDTKFNLKHTVELPYNSEWFCVPPAAPHGQTPKLGSLHAALVRPAFAAWTAAKKG